MNSNLSPGQALEVAQEQPRVQRPGGMTGSIEGVHAASERGEIIYLVDWDNTPCYIYRSASANALTQIDPNAEEEDDGS